VSKVLLKCAQNVIRKLEKLAFKFNIVQDKPTFIQQAFFMNASLKKLVD